MCFGLCHGELERLVFQLHQQLPCGNRLVGLHQHRLDDGIHLAGQGQLVGFHIGVLGADAAASTQREPGNCQGSGEQARAHQQAPV